MIKLTDLKTRIAELDQRRREWKWSRDNPLQAISSEIVETLDELASFYLGGTEKERAEIRSHLGKHIAFSNYIPAYVSARAKELKSPGDSDILLKALAAFSANDHRGDFRDELVQLGDLWLAAARAGIDPTTHFEKAASLSSDDAKDKGGTSMRTFLADFPKSAHFREAVKPELEKVGRA